MSLAEMEADIAFLLLRADCAGSCNFTNDRWTGMSSNSIVSVAYGGEQKEMPWDRSDYAACVRTVKRLPKHRRTPAVLEALQKARAAYLKQYPDHASSLARKAQRDEWDRQEKTKAERRAVNLRRRQRRSRSTPSQERQT